MPAVHRIQIQEYHRQILHAALNEYFDNHQERLKTAPGVDLPSAANEVDSMILTLEEMEGTPDDVIHSFFFTE